MAIGTYSELQAAVAAWLKRADLTARIVDFITLAEVRLNRTLRSRLAQVEQSTTVAAGDRLVTLPTGFTEPLAVWIVLSGDRVLLRNIDPALMSVGSERGQPVAWGVDGGSLAFDRPLDASYTIVMRLMQKFGLSDASPTNTLLADAPDVYLAATMCEAATFTRDADLLGVWEGKLRRSMAELNAKDARSRAPQTLATEPGQLSAMGRRDGFNIYRGV